MNKDVVSVGRFPDFLIFVIFSVFQRYTNDSFSVCHDYFLILNFMQGGCLVENMLTR